MKIFDLFEYYMLSVVFSILIVQIVFYIHCHFDLPWGLKNRDTKDINALSFVCFATGPLVGSIILIWHVHKLYLLVSIKYNEWKLLCKLEKLKKIEGIDPKTQQNINELTQFLKR